MFAPQSPPPRLLMTDARLDQARRAVDRDTTAARVLDRVRHAARRASAAPLLERRMDGRRLLAVARQALSRTARFCLLHALDGDPAWSERLQREIDAVLAFRDWNPDHFLDTAELATAVALALDTLHGTLSEERRRAWQQGLIALALEPSLERPDRPRPWIARKNNWGQVCHGGLTLAALAIADDHPEWLDRIIPRAVKHLPGVLETYAPDGAYPEGPTYWRYGTTFNVLFLEAVRNALGTTFDLDQAPGFAASARYLVQTRAPSGRYWNYADSGLGGIDDGVLLWMAETFAMPEVARAWIRQITPWLTGPLPPDQEDTETGFPQLLPLYLLWWPAEPCPHEPEPAPARPWIGRGPNPVAILNENDGPRGPFFVGIKGGTGTTSHAHLDFGSFCLEHGGIRWAIDPMRDPYEVLEAAGIHLWDLSQGGQRWDLVAYGHEGHGILTLDGKRPRVTGFADLVAHPPAERESLNVTVDLTAVLGPAVRQASRQLTVTDDRTVRITDRIETASDAEPATLRWRWITHAAARAVGPTHWRLEQDGAALDLTFSGPAVTASGWQVSTVALDTLRSQAEEPNPGEQALDACWSLAPGTASSLITECRLAD